ncbi:hypothetical protein XMIN_4551 [Xanthomonas citri pv. mangiferaeindicae LMG 941]|nr:hypothetical protein XMIN_4551 [Xanthomonas citri pv. mangiferaeindicae LMG 941]
MQPQRRYQQWITRPALWRARYNRLKIEEVSIRFRPVAAYPHVTWLNAHCPSPAPRCLTGLVEAWQNSKQRLR